LEVADQSLDQQSRTWFICCRYSTTEMIRCARVMLLPSLA
jgi:hypothetical protein